MRTQNISFWAKISENSVVFGLKKKKSALSGAMVVP